MSINQSQLQTLLQLAIEAASAAGQYIDEQRHGKIIAKHKDRGDTAASQVVTEVDHAAQAIIVERLMPSCSTYDLALLTEESPDDGLRQQKPAFWSIDPLDGTLPFTQQLPGFAVSIGLVAQSGEPLLGVVYDPVEHTLFHAISGEGAYKNGQQIEIPAMDLSQPLILRTDFSFADHPWLKQTRMGLEAMAEKRNLNGAEIQYRTGAVMNACDILETPHICYFKYPKSGNSGGSLWDYAATACLYQEAGAVASDIYGQAMALNRVGNTHMNHRGLLYTSDAGIAREVVALYQRLEDGKGTI